MVDVPCAPLLFARFLAGQPLASAKAPINRSFILMSRLLPSGFEFVDFVLGEGQEWQV
jgi:hypothetical protein